MTQRDLVIAMLSALVFAMFLLCSWLVVDVTYQAALKESCGKCIFKRVTVDCETDAARFVCTERGWVKASGRD